MILAKISDVLVFLQDVGIRGTSMTNAGIRNGDYAVMRRAVEPFDGKIMPVRYGNETRLMNEWPAGKHTRSIGTMSDLANLIKEAEGFGILNIDVTGDQLSPEVIKTAIEATKQLNSRLDG
jgi:hypothetical protein